MLTTTLAGLRAHGACAEGIETLIQSLPPSHAENDPIALAHILDSNGLDHAIWALRTQDPEYEARFEASPYSCPTYPIYAAKAAAAAADSRYADSRYAEEAAAAADYAYAKAREKQKQIFLDLVN